MAPPTGLPQEGSTSESGVLARYHSADTNRDAKFSLYELLRIIELYNTREGTTRTGGYRPAEDTVDGFTPDT